MLRSPVVSKTLLAHLACISPLSPLDDLYCSKSDQSEHPSALLRLPWPFEVTKTHAALGISVFWLILRLGPLHRRCDPCLSDSSP